MLRKYWLAIFVGILVIAGAIIVWQRIPAQMSKEVAPANQADTDMKLTSSAFANDNPIPDKYTCKGENINPPLWISDVPKNSKSLALIVDDPDAPLGTFTHWLVWNIASDTKEIPEGRTPERSQEGTNSAGKIGYTGPCPPSKHRYFFKLYALDTTVGLDGKAKVADLEAALKGHTIFETYIIGVYPPAP